MNGHEVYAWNLLQTVKMNILLEVRTVIVIISTNTTRCRPPCVKGSVYSCPCVNNIIHEQCIYEALKIGNLKFFRYVLSAIMKLLIGDASLCYSISK